MRQKGKAALGKLKAMEDLPKEKCCVDNCVMVSAHSLMYCYLLCTISYIYKLFSHHSVNNVLIVGFGKHWKRLA